MLNVDTKEYSNIYTTSSMCDVQCGAHGVFALRWIPAGSLSGDAHLHRGSGISGGIQTDMHTQTDRWIRTSPTRLEFQRNRQRQIYLHIYVCKKQLICFHHSKERFLWNSCSVGVVFSIEMAPLQYYCLAVLLFLLYFWLFDCSSLVWFGWYQLVWLFVCSGLVCLISIGVHRLGAMFD